MTCSTVAGIIENHYKGSQFTAYDAENVYAH